MKVSDILVCIVVIKLKTRFILRNIFRLYIKNPSKQCDYKATGKNILRRHIDYMFPT